jgi:hypothetical protein
MRHASWLARQAKNACLRAVMGFSELLRRSHRERPAGNEELLAPNSQRLRRLCCLVKK